MTAYVERYATARGSEGHPPVTTTPLREDVAEAARRLAAEGLLVGTAGNVSAREGDAIAITATGVVLGECTPEQVCVVSDAGEVVEGRLRPTSELDLHLDVYAATDAVGVVHTHAPFSTAVACVLDELPVLHYQQLLLGGAIRVAPYATFGTPELAAHVRDALTDRQAALMANHGSVAIGELSRQGGRARPAAGVAGRPPSPRQRARHPSGAHPGTTGRRHQPGPAPQLRIHRTDRAGEAMKSPPSASTSSTPTSSASSRSRRVGGSARRDDPALPGRHRRRHRGGAEPARCPGEQLRRRGGGPDRGEPAAHARGRGHRHLRPRPQAPTTRRRRR